MSRVRVIHWKAAEAGPLIEACRGAGHTVEFSDGGGVDAARAIRANPPDAVVIDLSRLPSHGREVGIWLRGAKATRPIPIVFANGEAEKVARTREMLPDATFTTTAKIAVTLKRVVGKKLTAPVLPPPMMQRYGGRTVAQKLGIVAGSSVAAVDVPRNFPDLLGALPEGVEFGDAGEITLWFVHEPDVLMASLQRMRRAALRSKLWLCWRKGVKKGVTEKFVMASMRDAGLVDYKICAVDAVWTGMAFALKKSA